MDHLTVLPVLRATSHPGVVFQRSQRKHTRALHTSPDSPLTLSLRLRESLRYSVQFPNRAMELSLSSLHEPRHFSPNLGFRTVNPILNQASRRRNLKLGFRSNSAVSVSSSISKSQPIGSSKTEQDKPAANPVYTPTPPNRDLRTPHSGSVCMLSFKFFDHFRDLISIELFFRYHFDGTARKFFEGWYFKVSIPERRQSFCFMYSVENPAFRKRLTPLEVAQHGPRTTGVGAQILGAGDKYICQYSEESANFWGSTYFLQYAIQFVLIPWVLCFPFKLLVSVSSEK